MTILLLAGPSPMISEPRRLVPGPEDGRRPLARAYTSCSRRWPSTRRRARTSRPAARRRAAVAWSRGWLEVGRWSARARGGRPRGRRGRVALRWPGARDARGAAPDPIRIRSATSTLLRRGSARTPPQRSSRDHPLSAAVEADVGPGSRRSRRWCAATPWQELRLRARWRRSRLGGEPDEKPGALFRSRAPGGCRASEGGPAEAVLLRGNLLGRRATRAR